MGHEDPLLGGRKREHLFVIEPLERQLLIERANIVAVGLEPLAHARS